MTEQRFEEAGGKLNKRKYSFRLGCLKLFRVYRWERVQAMRRELAEDLGEQ